MNDESTCRDVALDRCRKELDRVVSVRMLDLFIDNGETQRDAHRIAAQTEGLLRRGSTTRFEVMATVCR